MAWTFQEYRTFSSTRSMSSGCFGDRSRISGWWKEIFSSRSLRSCPCCRLNNTEFGWAAGYTRPFFTVCASSCRITWVWGWIRWGRSGPWGYGTRLLRSSRTGFPGILESCRVCCSSGGRGRRKTTDPRTVASVLGHPFPSTHGRK